MAPQNPPRDDPGSLRRRAEDLSGPFETPDGISLAETQRLLHELRVYQIELELQNEELRRSQTELEGARTRYFDLYDLAPVGYLTLNDKGLIVEANLMSATLFGVSRRDLAQRRLTTFILRDDQDEYHLKRARLMEAGTRQVSEARMVRADGTEFWARLESIRAEDAGGAPVVRVVISDITDRKSSEAQFAQSEKMESVGRLAGGLAHDFNNLLTVINGFSGLMLKKLSAGDASRPHLEAIHTAGEEAAELTQRLLAFGRKQVLRPSAFDVNRLISDMLPLIVGLAGIKVEISLKTNPETLPAHADPHQLEQVLVNLAKNAIEAMPEGGKLLIETSEGNWNPNSVPPHSSRRPGPYVMLAVSDTGVGMNEETRKRAFEPFFTTKAPGKGTGLGLSSVQGFVAQSGGHIEVQSEPGHGTTFRVFLPSAADAEVKKTAEVSEASEELDGTETILVVDDEAGTRDFAAIALETFGYQVIQAWDASEALVLYERNREKINLVLTDVVMPNMNGQQLADQLERSWPGIRVLFMSGFSSEIMVNERVLEPGAQMIQKPFNAADLARRVRSMLGPAKAGGSASAACV